MRKARTNQRLPCVKGAVAKRLRDCFERKSNLLQSLRHGKPCHLPLHKGGFGLPPGSVKKPSSGRKGDHEVVEGASVTLNLDILHCNALSFSRLRRQLPPRGSLI